MSVLRRRLVSISTLVLVAVVVVGAFPVLLVAAFAVDGVRWLRSRTHWMSVRLLLMAITYVSLSISGLIASTYVLLTWPSQRISRMYWIEEFWASSVFNTVRRVFGLQLNVTGADVLEPGPYVLAPRHISIIDNVMPAAVVSVVHGIHLRYVVKKQLLNEPSIDIFGSYLPNCFVDRSGSETGVQLDDLASLTEGLGPQDAVLLFPEGSRFDPEKAARAVVKVSESSPSLGERAAALAHVLPPRLGGIRTMLDAGLDVVVMRHHGLHGFARVSDVWAGGLVGRTIHVSFVRYARDDIPDDLNGQADWLYDVWSDVDQWVGAL